MNSEEQAFLKSLLVNKMCSPMRTSRAKTPESQMISPLIRRNISIFDTVNKINKFNLNTTKPSADGLTEFEVLDFLGKIPNYESYVLKWFKQFKAVDRNLMAAIMKKMMTMDMSDQEYCKELDKQLGLFLAGAATQGLLSSIDTNKRHIKTTDNDDDSDESWCKNVFDLQLDLEESKRQTKKLTTIFNNESGEDHSLKQIHIRIGNTNITINANKVPYVIEYPATGIDDVTKQKMGLFLSPICFLPLDLVNKLKGKNLASLMRRMLRTPRWSLNYMEFVSKEVEKFVMAQSKP